MSNVEAAQQSGIKLSERISYCTARIGFTLVLSLYNTSYGPLFLNTVCGVSMGTIASALALAKLLDLIEVLFFQPILFEWAAKGKLGRYRTWFIISPISCMVGHLMMQSYVTSVIPDSWKVPFVVIGYVIINATLNIQGTSLNSLNALWIKDPTERFKIQAQTSLVGNIVNTVFGFVMLPIMFAVGGVNFVNARGMTFLVVLYNLINVIVSIPVFRFTGKLDLDQGSSGAKVSPFSTIKLIFSNRNVAAMFFAQTFGTAGNSSWGQIFAFMFLYFYKAPGILSAYNGFSRGLMIFSNMVTIALVKKLKPRTAFRTGYIVQSVFYTLIYFIAKDGITAMVCVCINQMFVAIYQSATTPLYSEIAEYTHWETGNSITAVVFSAQQSTAKSATYVANFILTAVAAIGFSAADELTHTPQILANLKTLACFVPAGFFLVATIIFSLMYTITPAKLDLARKELAERAAEKA
ncbi:MAG: MFS transporter [Eubacteriaceae bacterium]|nr:MFS transporter [Eubacteriaceae bacterium]